MKILLLGATGLLGHNVLRRLLDSGHTVVAVVRSAAFLSDAAGQSQCEKLSIVNGSILEISTLRAASQGCDAIVNCAGTTDMSLLRYEDYLPVNKTLCENILRLMDETGINIYVHTSTANTIGYGTEQCPGCEGDEMKSPFADSYYAQSKREAELMIERYVAEHPCSHIVTLNPGFMVGAYDSKPSSGKLLLAGYRKRLMVSPMGGKSFVHVDDVAQTAVNALTMGTSGHRYLVVSFDLGISEFYAIQARVCGYRQKVVTLPSVLVAAAGRLGDLLRMLGIRTQLSTRNVRQLMVKEYYSNAKARRELAMPVTPIETAIKDFFEWQSARRRRGAREE